MKIYLYGDNVKNNNNPLTLDFDFKIMESDDHSLVKVNKPTKPEKDAYLNSLFKDPDFKDVTLVIEGQEFKAHKSVLAAASAVFRAMFTHNFKEKAAGRDDVTDVDGDTFGRMLKYIYTGELEWNPLVQKLLAAAHKYEIKSLVEKCGAIVG